MSNNSEWLVKYDPTNEDFWKEKGSAIAWKTLFITTLALVMVLV